MEKVKILKDWFPVTIYDWEEILLGLREDFIRLHSVPDYWEEHYSQDLLASQMIHGALLAALCEGVDLEMRLDYPIIFAGNGGILYEDGQLKISKKQFATSVVTNLIFTDYGPVIKTMSGSLHLLIGGDRAWDIYPYLEDVGERPDLISRIFSVY